MKEKKLTLVQWLIEKLNTDNYRAGKPDRNKHPALNQKELDRMGGIRLVIPQARELEKMGLLTVKWENLGADIGKLHFSPEIMGELCRMEGIEDPRQRNLRQQAQVREWRSQAGADWLNPYYDWILGRLEAGKEAKEPDLQDEPFFRCLNAAARMAQEQKTAWKRVFSAAVLGNSKMLEKVYEGRILSVLRNYSPLYEEGMEDDQIWKAHGILTYAQTLEWKGPLVYRFADAQTGEERTMDTSTLRYGAMTNAQTLEHAVPCALPGVKRIMTIENKANYEDMPYAEDTLYIFCHGFFSPKELRFLLRLRELAGADTEFLHWGDMDYGGIRIFCYNQKRLFPKLTPYRMGREDFEEAIRQGAGIPMEEGTRKKLMAMDAGALDELKNCILDSGKWIEQEILLAGSIRGQISGSDSPRLS